MRVLISSLVALISLLSADARGLRVAFVGDPQAGDEKELDYARRSIYRELRERKDLDMAVILGDLVNDKVALVAPSKESLDSLNIPWFCVPGNHDLDSYENAPRDSATFRKAVGYTDTVFTVKGIRFILVDNVRTVGMRDYTGGFTDSQKEWLASLMREGASFKRTVLVTHIPMFGCEDDEQFIKDTFSLCPKLTLVSGHLHNVYRHELELSGGVSVQEHVVGAACGSWWRGVKDADGIPYALQNCGAPRGWFLAEFDRKGNYTLDFVPIGQRNDRFSAFLMPDGRLVVNVFGGSKDGRLRVRIGKEWHEMKPYGEPAPEVQKVIAANLKVTREYRRAHRDEFIPLRRLQSGHVWCLESVPESFSGKIEIDYSDPVMKIRAKAEPEIFTAD